MDLGYQARQVCDSLSLGHAACAQQLRQCWVTNSHSSTVEGPALSLLSMHVLREAAHQEGSR